MQKIQVNKSDDYSVADSVSSGQIQILSADVAGLRLDQVLARLFPQHSRSRLQLWLKAGSITLDGQCRPPKYKVAGGERLVVAIPEVQGRLENVAQAIDMPIVFEDDSIIVIDKPAGLVVHPGNGNPDGTLLNALLHHDAALSEIPRAGIVHRLDKDTSGLLVVARTLAAQTDLVRQLQARSVKRCYQALVQGHCAADGKVDAPIGRHVVNRVRMAVTSGGKEALTYFRRLAQFETASWVECRLATGRTHQIRVHMAHIGHPLLGDPVYGGRAAGRQNRAEALLTFNRQALHAVELALNHPRSGERMTWHSSLPPDFQQLLDTLRQRKLNDIE